MILYSVRARVAKLGPEPAQWANQVAGLVSKLTGETTEVAARLGGAQDIIWVSRYKDFAAFEKAQSVVQNAEYQGLLKIAEDRGLFVTGSAETAIWQTLT